MKAAVKPKDINGIKGKEAFPNRLLIIQREASASIPKQRGRNFGKRNSPWKIPNQTSAMPSFLFVIILTRK